MGFSDHKGGEGLSTVVIKRLWENSTLPWDFSAETRAIPKEFSTITNNRIKLNTNSLVENSPGTSTEIPQLTDSRSKVLKAASEG